MSYLYPFSPNVTQLAPNSVSRSNLTTNPHDISSPGSLNSLMPHASGLFNTFLNTWSKNPANPSLLDKAPSPFQLCSNPNQSTSSAGPIIPHPLDKNFSRKLSTHKHSWFRPYESSWPLHAVSSFPPPINHPVSYSYDDLSSPTPLPHIAPSTHTRKNETTPITIPPSTFNPPTSSFVSLISSSISFAVPTIISKGKGKSKLILDDDDLPLAQLKKLKTKRHVSDSSNSDLESAVFSLTKLQDDPYFKGPIHKFLTSPLFGSQGQMVDFMPAYGGGFVVFNENSQSGHSKLSHFGGGFAALSEESSCPVVAPKNTYQPFVLAVCGAHSILQVPYTSMSTSMDRFAMSSDHMDIHQAHVSPAAVAVS
jgi:hypothetical protein